jgi:hypothetical protein
MLAVLRACARQFCVSHFHLACLHFAWQEDDGGLEALEAARNTQGNRRGFFKAMPS